MPRHLIIITVFSYIFITTHFRVAQTLPPCSERPGYLNNPWVNAEEFCLEHILDDSSAGELGFTALAAAPDGTLYAARPMTGEVLAIEDSDGDGLPDAARVVAEDLTLPNGLTYHDKALYISGGANIYRLHDGELETIIDDVPAGTGYWTGDLVIGADERIYIITGNDCVYESCISDDPLRGAVLSYALDGGDRRVILSDLQEPIGIAFYDGALWITDSDRLIQHENGTTQDFPSGSRPSMIVSYTSNTLPTLQNTMLVVLRGTADDIDLPGFAIAAVRFDEPGYEVIVPAESNTPAKLGFTLKEMSYRTSGFWPHMPMGVDVSSEGWVYISIGGGRIVVIRPI